MKLSDYLAAFVADGADGKANASLAAVIERLALAAGRIDRMVRLNGFDGDLGRETGDVNADGDCQKALDVRAEEVVVDALSCPQVAAILSEEKDTPIMGNDGGDFIVALDPIDGSSNISVNMTIGTIFSILPASGGLLQKGRNQLAAGFFAYGPQTTLILTLAGNGVDEAISFIRHPDDGAFVRVGDAATVAPKTSEVAINAAYAQHWFTPMKKWMDDTLGAKKYRLRWTGSMVADAWRIFQRGGVFLYPPDCRDGNTQGRLRLIYEANPIALLIEASGGKASDGMAAILDIQPTDLHERVPLYFGASDEIDRIEQSHSNNRS